MKLKEFKIRCSAIGQIKSTKITDIQAAKIIELQEKTKITENQRETLQQLLIKRDNPELTQTTKSYLKLWVLQEIYKRKKRIKSKYFDKGNFCEPLSIERYNKTYGSFGSKNDESFENDFMTGMPDMLLPEIVVDFKNSYEPFTFPLFENIIDDDYFGQLQGYMELTGKKKAELVYTLENMPIELIEKELFSMGLEYTLENEKYFLYDDVDDSLRIKKYSFDYDESFISTLENDVDLCRKYINDVLLKNYK